MINPPYPGIIPVPIVPRHASRPFNFLFNAMSMLQVFSASSFYIFMYNAYSYSSFKKKVQLTQKISITCYSFSFYGYLYLSISLNIAQSKDYRSC